MNEVSFVMVRLCVIVIATIISVYAIPVLKGLAEDRMDARILEVIDKAVHAAEQTLKDNEEKKSFVINTVTAWLLERGLSISADQLDMLVEAAVNAMKVEMK